MIKSLSCAAAALAFGASAAVAGPYANVEANAGWVGSDYSGNVTDLHLGYEYSEGPYSVYAPRRSSVRLSARHGFRDGIFRQDWRVCSLLLTRFLYMQSLLVSLAI